MPTHSSNNDALFQQMLHRDDSERAREFRYRMAQAIVFGLPVILLDWMGDQLGGRGAGLWSGAFQMLLSGWVLYVGAAGMGFEGIVRLYVRPRRLTADLPIAVAAASVWLWSCVCLLTGFVAARAGHFPPRPAGPGFELCIWILAVWSFARSRYFRVRPRAHDSSRH